MKKGILCILSAAIMTVSSVPVLASDTDFVISDDTKLDNGEEAGDNYEDNKPSRPSGGSSSSSSSTTTKPSDESTLPDTVVTVNPFERYNRKYVVL